MSEPNITCVIGGPDLTRERDTIEMVYGKLSNGKHGIKLSCNFFREMPKEIFVLDRNDKFLRVAYYDEMISLPTVKSESEPVYRASFAEVECTKENEAKTRNKILDKIHELYRDYCKYKGDRVEFATFAPTDKLR
jgi:hypothetical protein